MSLSTLQPNEGSPLGEHYLRSEVDNVQWGWLPNAVSKPVFEMASGATITVDTVSHEGMMDDQGRDPQAWFAQFGVRPGEILADARAIADGVERRNGDGPHVVTGPIAVTGSRAGDILKVEVLHTALRTRYGVISSRHGLGALPGEFPETPPREDGADRFHAGRFHSCFTFVSVEQSGGQICGVLNRRGLNPVRFPLDPHMGIMSVASDTDEPVHSNPPGLHGGNVDVKLLGSGSTFYLPVQVDGALFATGDPHYSQGNGEVALTAFEAPLRTTFRLTTISAAAASGVLGALREPFGENSRHWIVIGLDRDLSGAMKAAVRSAIGFLETAQGMDRATAMAYLSAAADFEISQVVDGVQGVHCLIRKSDFRQQF
ncbi:acetamidase/formamidase family protein [Rhodococcus jostii]|uniref:Acetamidase/formamidase n=1 Tax=Rhodococcus jostii TaxID=132919 RepID=A0A1H4ISR3_RHOJO|nr:acetamidase/formamidase family protein [Rhodococcus jostii]SEB37110.1 Acetamidase/formamidase [Rhodococcus jostii]